MKTTERKRANYEKINTMQNIVKFNFSKMYKEKRKIIRNKKYSPIIYLKNISEE